MCCLHVLCKFLHHCMNGLFIWITAAVVNCLLVARHHVHARIHEGDGAIHGQLTYVQSLQDSRQLLQATGSARGKFSSQFCCL